MPGDLFNLLTDPWISTIDSSGKRRSLTLPAVFASLAGGDELEFVALQGHQQQAWYAFLVQTAAMALHRSEGEADQSESDWHDALITLADDPAAWCLLSNDLSKPAFFQPPVPEGNLGKFKRPSPSPAILEVLIAAKNHDIKADRYTATPSVEHWAFALVTLQTTEGFLGRGNYGIARMNGGFSSRPHVGIAPGLGWSARLRRDLPLLLDQRQSVVLSVGYEQRVGERGLGLLWEKPWAGNAAESLDLGDLDPYFIEVCRRVRLTQEGSQIVARVANTDAPRVDAKERFGILGDPFTPVGSVKEKQNSTALTVADNGFHYRLVARLLFEGLYNTPALKFQAGDNRGLATFKVLVRGQGKTGGLHERHVPVPPNLAVRFQKRESLASINTESRARIELVNDAQKRLLKPALLTLAQDRVGQNVGQDLNWKDNQAAPWIDRFDHEVDRVFFAKLFDDLGEGITAEERQTNWQTFLYALAKKQLEDAIETLAPAGVHRFRSISRALSLFEGLARSKVLPSAIYPSNSDVPGGSPSLSPTVPLIDSKPSPEGIQP